MSVALADIRFDSPMVRLSNRRRRRLASLLVVVALPVALAVAYLYGIAADQYVTEFRFSVRHEQPLRADPAQGPAAALAGPGSVLTAMTDSQIVIQYLKSRQIVGDLTAAGIDLDAIYARDNGDFLAALTPGDSAERRLRYWRRMVDPFFDMTTGIVSVEVRAFSPADAQRVATAALALSEKLVNGLTARAHADVVAYASAEVRASEDRLKAAQAAMAAYRDRHAVLFPEMQATADTSVEGQVQASLVEAKAAYATRISQGVAQDALPMRILAGRIAALEGERHGVHAQMAGAAGATLASVLSAYDGLKLDESIAAKVYERALISLQDAHNAAAQQSVYLAAFVRPALPEDSLYPVRWRALLEVALLSFAAWCLGQLLYHGIRDHLD
jgi:capsular polysaccharide transport system permease protein